MTDEPENTTPPTDDNAESNKSDTAPEADAAKRSRKKARNPVFHFVFWFAVIMTAFSIFFFAFFTQWPMFEDYLKLNARVSGQILVALGEEVNVKGASIYSTRGSLQIKHGCDAIFPSALFVGAVLASPLRFRRKILGIFIGSVVLLSINLVRIISLYYVQLFWPRWFHIMHVDVWQPAFIFLALFFWILWAVRATRIEGMNQNVSV